MTRKLLRKRTCLYVALILPLPITTPYAQTMKVISESRTVASGRVIVLSSFGSADVHCDARMIPEVTVQQAPAHGTLAISDEKVTMTTSRVGNVDCTGRVMDGRRVRLRPVPGYVGPDHVVLLVRFSVGTVEYDYDITVTPAR